MRIVSLIPSATEIVYALGAGQQLVGRSHECDFPAEAGSLPALTETRFYPEGSSYEIDQKVKAIVREASSVYRIDEELLKELKPDVILTQSQCEVCAVSSDQLEGMIREVLGNDVQLIDMRIDRLDDLYEVISGTARLLGKEKNGQSLNESIKEQFSGLTSLIPKQARPLNAAFIEWLIPPMTAGHWIPEIAAMAGANPVLSPAPGADSPFIGIEKLVEEDPEYILLIPCGYSINDTLSDLDALREQPEWHKLSAVKNNQVFIADGNQYYNRPGPRLTTALRILCEIFYPDVFQPENQNSGWVKMPSDS